MYSDTSFLTTLVWLMVIGTSIWVFFDANSIGIKKGQVQGIADMGAGGWFLACLLLWLIAFPLYLSKRSEFKTINQRTSVTNVSPQPHQSQQRIPGADEKKCPYCAEIIKREAIVCRFCGRELNQTSPAIAKPMTAPASKLIQDAKNSASKYCPKCVIPMEVRVYQDKSYYVCPNYKQCQQVFPVE